LWILLLFFLATFPAACANKTMTVGAAAYLLEDIANASYKQSNLRVIKDGMPAYLLLMDGMVEALPDNDRLLISAAQGYASYASAFVEGNDKPYAIALYSRAKGYALRALAVRGFKNPLSSNFDDFKKSLSQMDEDEVPYLFWAASCWGSWIALNMESMEALAELPRVELIMNRVLALDEGFYYGGPHLFMGILQAARPKIAGGDLPKAREHFLKAIELGQGKFLMAYIYYADNYARKAFEKDLFIATLNEALKKPADIVPELTLLNTVAHKKANAMLNQVDEYF